jgi:hypothetical protein
VQFLEGRAFSFVLRKVESLTISSTKLDNSTRRGVGVSFRRDDHGFCRGDNVNVATVTGSHFEISSGMEFMDSGYFMRITSVTDNVIYARRMYKLLGNRSVQAYGCDSDVAYANMTDIINQIQEVLE